MSVNSTSILNWYYPGILLSS